MRIYQSSSIATDKQNKILVEHQRHFYHSANIYEDRISLSFWIIPSFDPSPGAASVPPTPTPSSTASLCGATGCRRRTRSPRARAATLTTCSAPTRSLRRSRRRRRTTRTRASRVGCARQARVSAEAEAAVPVVVVLAPAPVACRQRCFNDAPNRKRRLLRLLRPPLLLQPRHPPRIHRRTSMCLHPSPRL